MTPYRSSAASARAIALETSRKRLRAGYPPCSGPHRTMPTFRSEKWQVFCRSRNTPSPLPPPSRIGPDTPVMRSSREERGSAKPAPADRPGPLALEARADRPGLGGRSHPLGRVAPAPPCHPWAPWSSWPQPDTHRDMIMIDRSSQSKHFAVCQRCLHARRRMLPRRQEAMLLPADLPMLRLDFALVRGCGAQAGAVAVQCGAERSAASLGASGSGEARTFVHIDLHFRTATAVGASRSPRRQRNYGASIIVGSRGARTDDNCMEHYTQPLTVHWTGFRSGRNHTLGVMPALVASIHVFLAAVLG